MIQSLWDKSPLIIYSEKIFNILKILEEQGSEISLVLFSGVQYYTGQLFQIKEITEAAHKQVYIYLLSI